MNRNFVVSLLAVTLAYLFVPKISTIITIVAVTIFICQLAAILARLVIHSSYSPKLYVPPTNRMVLITGCDSELLPFSIDSVNPVKNPNQINRKSFRHISRWLWIGDRQAPGLLRIL